MFRKLTSILAIYLMLGMTTGVAQVGGKAVLGGKITIGGGAGGGGGSGNFQQACVHSSAAGTDTCVLATVSTGQLVIYTSKTGTAAQATVAVSHTGTAVATWNSAIVTTFDNGFEVTIAWTIVTTGGSMTVQAAWTGGLGSFADSAVAVYSPLSAFTGLDVIATPVSGNGYNDISSSNCNTGSITTTNANDLVIAICDSWNNAQTWGALGGYTQRALASRNTTGWYDQFVSSTNTFSPVIPLSAADITFGIVLAFKD